MSVALLAASLAAAPAMAAFVFRVGDAVYVDGHKYTLEEWKKIRDTYESPTSSAPTAVSAVRPPATSPARNDAHAASCVTSIYYDEFPSEDERFDCTAGLGSLTREEILRRGWKVDFVDKVPAPSAQKSPRGLPLYQYKLVISR